MDQKLNETSILTFTLVNKDQSVYKDKNQKPAMHNPTIAMAPQSSKESIVRPQSHASIIKGKERTVVFNKNTEISESSKNETKAKCGCSCFDWIFGRKSKDGLLENKSQNDSENVVKNSGI